MTGQGSPIDRLTGTVTNGQTFSGATAELPLSAPGMIARLPGVTSVQDTGTVTGVNAYKSPLIPPIETNAISVDAATLGLPAAAGTSLAQGRYLNAIQWLFPGLLPGSANQARTTRRERSSRQQESQPIPGHPARRRDRYRRSGPVAASAGAWRHAEAPSSRRSSLLSRSARGGQVAAAGFVRRVPGNRRK